MLTGVRGIRPFISRGILPRPITLYMIDFQVLNIRYRKLYEITAAENVAVTMQLSIRLYIQQEIVVVRTHLAVFDIYPCTISYSRGVQPAGPRTEFVRPAARCGF